MLSRTVGTGKLPQERDGVYVIAEAGSCHDGDFQQARALVVAAKLAGADAVKFQYWSDPWALGNRRKADDHYVELYRRYQVPLEWLPDLREAATHEHIDFMCTAYLPEDVQVVSTVVDHFKVASFESGARDLLAAHVPFMDADITNRRLRLLFISVGMGLDDGLIAECVNHGTRAKLVRLLLCTSSYPAPVTSLNLRRLWASRQWYELDGFSDHSDPRQTWTGALAVAAGAGYVEAHLRLLSTDPANPDAPHAMVPGQFAEYVRFIRLAESCLGTGDEGVQTCEQEMARYKVRGR